MAKLKTGLVDVSIAVFTLISELANHQKAMRNCEKKCLKNVVEKRLKCAKISGSESEKRATLSRHYSTLNL